MDDRSLGALGFGVAGTLDHQLAAELAAAAERAGYATFWANDLPNGEGLAALAAAAAATTTIGLGVGVIPLDRQPATAIARRIDELGLPVARLLLGVGSGTPGGGLDRVRQGVAELRELTSARIAVGALGPRMCALAGEAADAVLLNWLTPEHAVRSAGVALAAAAAAGRPRPRVVGYVRVALDEALPRLREESARYAGYPAYAANFARMGVSALETTVHGPNRAAVAAGLGGYRAALDETVVRCIADDAPGAYRRLLDAAAP